MANLSNKQLIGASIASAAILLGGLSACSKTESAASLVAEAKQFQAKGDHKAAIIQLKNALSNSPQDADARLTLASSYNEMGDAVSAEKEVRKAISLGAAPDQAMPALAQALLVQGQFQKVLDESEAAIDNQAPRLLTIRGDAYLALGQAEKAKESYQLALQSQADYADALLGLARHAAAQNDPRSASSFAEQALAKSPKNPEAWLFKGDLLRASGKVSEALAAYDQVLAHKPDHRAANLSKAYVHISTKKFDAAKTELDAASKLVANAVSVYYAQALLDFTQNKWAAAMESLQKVLHAAPEHMPSTLMAGAAELELGSLQQSEQHLRKYIKHDPENAYARKLLATLLLKTERAAEALAVLAPVLKNTQLSAEMLALAGQANLQAKNFNKATEYFEKASALAPQMAELHTGIAISKLGQRDYKRAVSELEVAARLDASPKSGIMLVTTQLRLKQFDQAIATITALEKQQPNNPSLQNLKGGAYLAKGDRTNARISFEKVLATTPDNFSAVANLTQLDLLDKKPAIAKQRLEAFLAKNKKSVHAMSALAGLAGTQGNQGEATRWLERANSENPDAVAPAIQLATQYLRTGQKQKALSLVRKLQVANPTSAELLDLLGQAQLANDDKAGALDAYGKLVNLTPKSASAQFRLAAVHLQLKNDAAAGEHLKKAMALQADFLEGQLLQVELAKRAGKFDQGLAIARTIQAQRAKLPVGHIVEGDLWRAQTKPEQALHAYEKAFALQKTATMMINLHIVMSQAGKGQEADRRMAQWLKEHPGDIPASLYVAELNIQKKQYKIAIDHLEAVLKTQPGNAAALNNLAWAYLQQKDPRALARAEQASQIAGENPAVLDTLGWILVEQGNTGRALPILQKAVSLAPGSPAIRYHLAAGLYKSGDKAKARKELEQVLDSKKNFAQLAEARALLDRL